MKRRNVWGVIVMSVIAVTLLTNSYGCTPSDKTEEFPTKDIRYICAWDAGGGGDAIVRKTASLMEKYLPVNVYVENISGGISGLGIYEVMKSDPVGYDLVNLSYDSTVTVPRKELVPGYDLNLLKMICMTTAEGRAVVVAKDAPWQTLDEFIADAKANPGELVIGNDGLGGGAHLGAVVMEKDLGIEVKHIPYPGGAGPQKEGLLSGEAQAQMTSLGDFSAIIAGGDARGLAVMGIERNPKFLDVPTFRELGYDLVMGSFQIVACRADTPPERVRVLENALYQVHEVDPEFKNWCAEIGIQAPWMSSAVVTDWAMADQKAVWSLMDELIAKGIIKE